MSNESFHLAVTVMKTDLTNRVLLRMMLAGGCIGLLHTDLPAQEKAPEPSSKVSTGKPIIASEKVPFLGLVLGPVDGALSSQIDLPEGVGVVVRAVMPDSPAARAGVQQHDVLHYFNDQLLVNESQLQTLVRQAGVGTEITLKLLRKGKSEQTTVKLGEHEEQHPVETAHWRGREPGVGAGHGPEAFFRSPHHLPGTDDRPFGFSLNGERFERQVRELSERMKELEGRPEAMREEIERFQKRIQEQTRKATELLEKHANAANSNGPSQPVAPNDKTNAVTSQTNTSRTTWSDNDGSGELIIEDGKKQLTVKDRDGKQVFSGPVNTPEEMKALPTEVRERLEKIEKSVKVDVRTQSKSGEL